MLNVMKKKARKAVKNNDAQADRPIYNAIYSKLSATLNPTRIELVDNSHQHAGHAGGRFDSNSTESHFQLYIVSQFFEDVPLLKRHQIIYALLQPDVMDQIHALQIQAKAPSEI